MIRLPVASEPVIVPDDRSRKSIVVGFRDLLRNDVDAEVALFNMGHGEEDGTMPQGRRKFFDHGNESSR